MILFTDDVLKAIEHDIASHKPERGGALLGPANTNLISQFLYDGDAKTSAATYTPSSRLVDDVKQVERLEDLTFKGIIHSHPGGFDRPSSADLHGFANNLAHNPHMGRFIAPIITMAGKPVGKHPYEIALGENAKLSCFAAVRLGKHQKQTQPVDFTPCPVMVLPIGKATRLLQSALEKKFDLKLNISDGHLNVNGLTMVSKILNCDLFQLDLLFPHNFPSVSPIALLSLRKGERLLDAQVIELPWSIICFETKALSQKLTPMIGNKLKENCHV